MQLTQKLKISPTKEQETLLLTLSEKCRLIYNFALTERRRGLDAGTPVGYIKQQNDLPKIKKKYPEYCWIYSKVLQMTLKKLDADYKSYFALKQKDSTAQPPHYKGKNYFTTMCFNQSGFKYDSGKIELSHKHPSKVNLSFNIPEKFSFEKICQIELYKKDGSYWVSIIHEVKEKLFVDNGLYQTFDLGITKQTAVNMEGKFFEVKPQRPDRYWAESLSVVQSRRDHCKKYSNKWNFLNLIVKKIKRKSSNQMRDNLHKMSKKVIENTKANTIIVGDISPKQMCQIDKRQKSLHGSLQNTGIISRFVGFLTYKAQIVGKRIVENSEYKSSQRCCVCKSEHKMPLHVRVYVCDNCGNCMDRDRNSAVNSMIDYLSQNGLWIAYWRFVNNLRQTGLTIVSHSQEAMTSNPGGLGHV